MSVSLSFNPESILGFKIIYNNDNNVKKSITVGAVGNAVTEISINTSPVNSKDSGPYEIMDYSLSTITKNNNRLIEMQVVLPANTLIIKYSKELFALFTIRQQFKSSNHHIEVFKEDYRLLNNSKFGTISPMYFHLVKDIIEIISMPVVIQAHFYERIQLLSQVIMATNQASLEINENNNPISLELVQIINNVISNNFTYPRSKDIQRITSSAQKTFEKEVRCYTPGTLKEFLSEIKFKSGLYQITYTKKPFREIALDHGFSDQSAFTRSIKAKTGFSPRILRKYSKEGLFNLLLKSKVQII